MVTATAALITAVASLAGVILKFVLSWQQEQHRQQIAQAVLERERMELEKKNLALERLPHEVERDKPRQPKSRMNHWMTPNRDAPESRNCGTETAVAHDPITYGNQPFRT